MVAKAAIIIWSALAVGCSSPAAPTPKAKVCHTEVVTAAYDKCDVIVYSNGTYGLVCSTVPAVTKEVCE